MSSTSRATGTRSFTSVVNSAIRCPRSSAAAPTEGPRKHGSHSCAAGSTIEIVAWLAATTIAAGVVLALRNRIGVAVANGIAGGLLFSVGDIATKVTTQGGARFAFVVPLIAGYTLGTALLQVGYQRGGALTVAGLATLLTNALPIAAGTVVLGEDVPAGTLGVLRVLAFAAVTIGAILLARPEKVRA